MTISSTEYNQLREERAEKLAGAHSLVERVKKSGRDLNAAQHATMNATIADVKAIDEKLTEYGAAGKAAIDTLGDLGGFDSDQRDPANRTYGGAVVGKQLSRTEWAVKAANVLNRAAHGNGLKAITSGSVDLPTFITPDTVALPDSPERLVDVLINRQPLQSNAYAYLRQTARTNNAAPVADLALKPTSTFTFEEVEDRARVIAHLSEQIPVRFFEDLPGLISVLGNEMARGVIDALEAQVINGDGVGENFTGIWNTPGITTQAYTTSLFVTARRARTTLRNRGESPSAWVFNPSDAEAIDLTADGQGNYFDGATVDHIFGAIPRLVSSAIPAGFALLGDFTQTQLFIREGIRLDADKTGVLFDRNAVKCRAEMRAGFGVLRAQALLKVDTAA